MVKGFGKLGAVMDRTGPYCLWTPRPPVRLQGSRQAPCACLFLSVVRCERLPADLLESREAQEQHFKSMRPDSFACTHLYAAGLPKGWFTSLLPCRKDFVRRKALRDPSFGTRIVWSL